MQRKCACGGTPGPTGECAACRRKRPAGPLQAKLTINQPDDKYEREANWVADQVMRMPEPRLQRQAGLEEEEEDELFQTKLQVQRKVDSQAIGNTTPPIVHDVLNSPGQPLDPSPRQFMEFRFGHDFSKVRVHTDARATESARAVNALAYMVGEDVVFGTGQYRPRANLGQKLLAPELTHVQQQSSNRHPQLGILTISDAADPLIEEANTFADNVTNVKIAKTRSSFSEIPQPAKHSVLDSAHETALMQSSSTSWNFGQHTVHSSVTAAGRDANRKAVSPELEKLLTGELIGTIRDYGQGTMLLDTHFPDHRPHHPSATYPTEPTTIASKQSPHPDPTSVARLENVTRISEAWGSRIAETLLNSRPHPAWGAFGYLPSTASVPHLSEVNDPGDSDNPTLMSIDIGEADCNLTLGLPWINVTDPGCTARCTLLHESTHFSDILPCCVRAGIAYRAAPSHMKATVATQWGTWKTLNRPWLECRAYRVSQTCANAMNAMLLCWAPESVVEYATMAAGGIVGGLVGSHLAGLAGASAGAAAGTTGGPLSPVTVPTGAVAGFISGELLGILAGAGIGAMAGAGAEALRRQCCDRLKTFRDTAEREIELHCGSARTRCPW